jgi:LAS superfamily LD-carboxypeptidase LdcB
MSIYRFVSKDRALTDKKYAPNDLEYISGAYISTSGRTGLALRHEARDALWDMARAFDKKFGVPLTVISTYRSAAYQQRMWDLGKCSDTLCAPA